MAKQYKIPDEGAQTNLTFGQKIKVEFDKHGLIASFLIVFTALNGIIWLLALNFMTRADRQADTNLRIGNIEGKLEIILNDRQNLEKNRGHFFFQPK